MTMETLLNYSKTYAELKPWLKNQLEKIAQDPRKSVASRANKYLKSI
jgi:hypothetical protein